ncbi:hypothetical protein EV1_026279 [Malus domestica]
MEYRKKNHSLRNVYKVSTQNPGSDVAAETAAALVAASVAFKDSDSSYSEKLLHTAMKDELLWGASWIHRASKNSSYLAYIKSNGHTLGAVHADELVKFMM